MQNNCCVLSLVRGPGMIRQYVCCSPSIFVQLFYRLTDLDADLDDDDLVEFFSHSPMPPDSKKNVQKKDDVDYGFDTLDADDLAELEETDFDTTEGVSSNKSKNGSTKEEDDTHSNKRDFTISYNCEKKERPMEETLVESSDDEAVEQVRSGHRRKKKES